MRREKRKSKMQQRIAKMEKRKADPIIVRVRLMWRKFRTLQFSQQMCTSSDKHCQGYTLFRPETSIITRIHQRGLLFGAHRRRTRSGNVHSI
jgi:hypothetical protein